jgi:hypothetical protein
MDMTSRKFIMALVGVVLCILWAAFKWEKEYLGMAMGFVGIYTTGNILEKKIVK